MAELDLLRDLESRSHLLSTPGDQAELKRAAWMFTRAAVRVLGPETWALVKAPPGGNQIDGVRIDKIIHRQSLEVVDIISDSESPTHAPAWTSQGIGEAWMVVPIDSEPTEPDDGTVPDLATLIDRMDAIGDMLADLGQELPRNTAELARVAALLERAIVEVNKLSAQGLRIRF
jgi:hypothetical protein